MTKIAAAIISSRRRRTRSLGVGSRGWGVGGKATSAGGTLAGSPTPHTPLPTPPLEFAPLMKAVIVIPARWASSRFPGKPLAVIAGVSLIQRVYERAARSKRASAVYVAT